MLRTLKVSEQPPRKIWTNRERARGGRFFLRLVNTEQDRLSHIDDDPTTSRAFLNDTNGSGRRNVLAAPQDLAYRTAQSLTPLKVP